MRKSFTLMEIMITSVIILTLATLGIGGYIYILENAKKRACLINQETWVRVAEIKARETGVLGKLDLRQDLDYIEKAYAQIMDEANWFTKFSYFFIKINASKSAYAAITDLLNPDVMKKYGIDPQILICPSSGLPYGINANLQSNQKWEEIPAGTILIGDCKTDTFDTLDDLNPAHFNNFLTGSGESVATTVEGIGIELNKTETGSSTSATIPVGNMKLKVTDKIFVNGGSGEPKLNMPVLGSCKKCVKDKNSAECQNCPVEVEKEKTKCDKNDKK